MPHQSRTRRPRRSPVLGALAALLISAGCSHATTSHAAEPAFRVLAFFTGKQDQAHISFLHEAVVWFPEQAARNGFHFDTTSNWANLNDDFLKHYQAEMATKRVEYSEHQPVVDAFKQQAEEAGPAERAGTSR